MRRRLGSVAASILLGAGAFALTARALSPSPAPIEAQRGLMLLAERARHLDDEEIDSASCDETTLDHGLVLPSGDPAGLGCDEARTVVQQARDALAAPAAGIDAAKFAEGTIDWLDPHGLWSVAPDAPVGPMLRRNGGRLLAELEAPAGVGSCAAASAVGRELVRWSDTLRASFDDGEREGARGAPSPEAAWKAASTTPYEDGRVTRDGRDLARAIGRAAGALRGAYGETMAPYITAARARTAPRLDAEGWSRVVIAAALRAYVPQLDVHGAWAPLDEELSIYDLALEAAPPERLWSDITRTAIGVRIDHGALAPLADGDVVLKVQDVPLAGVSVEQVEQLSVIEGARLATSAPTRVTVLRRGAEGPVELAVRPPRGSAEPAPREAPAADLALDLIRYGDGRAAVIGIPDVPDDLGSRLVAALDKARGAGDLRGVVLDLRANGGGSTDGATAALGAFIPGASLFPMRRRDGAVEVERAPDIPAEKRWSGPVAVLVDGDSASAAEMIAGALAAYRRAVVIGDRTYGKGCAQEYFDDDAHAGVLRLTTLLYALPDGSPVQKVGITPTLRLDLPAGREREATLARALGPWRGPDVRDAHLIHEVPWPNHGGRVGPCQDPMLCRALRALGIARSASR